MKYLLDTNACIKYINGDSESVKLKLQSFKPEDIILCSIVKSELIYGVLKSTNKTKNREKLDHYLSSEMTKNIFKIANEAVKKGVEIEIIKYAA